MPVGRVKLAGNLGAQTPYGKALPSTGAALALRGAAKMGLGRGAATAAEPAPDPELGKALRGAFGIPAAKRTSKGRQNQPVKAAKPVPVASTAKPAKIAARNTTPSKRRPA